MPSEESKYLQEDLDLKWLKLKIELTNWLSSSLKDMPKCVDYKGIKCTLDSLAIMEKLIGPTAPTPSVKDHDKEVKNLGKRLKGVSERMGFDNKKEI